MDHEPRTAPDSPSRPAGAEPWRALLSASDPARLEVLARQLHRFGWELWATDGTAAHLEQASIPVRRLSELTGVGSMLGGRLKTLHPRVFAGVLARPTGEDLAQLASLQAPAFDLVVVDFYPFEQAAAREPGNGAGAEPLVELIDIGGPALVRAAAKNHARVAVLCHPNQYDELIQHLERTRGAPPDAEWRRRLAVQAFRRTSAYDAAVAQALAAHPAEARLPEGPRRPGPGPAFPGTLHLEFALWQKTRYGENPHQAGAVYRTLQPVAGSVPWGRILQGKELSYNNVADATAAWLVAWEFSDRAAACAVKHGTPCGVGVSEESLLQAYERAYEADSVSIFGGVVALNRPVDRATAQAMARTFLEVVAAPSFTDEAKEVLAQKPNLRLIEVGPVEEARRAAGGGAWPDGAGWEVRSIPGGLLVQTPDAVDLDEGRLKTVTRARVPEHLWPELRFAWKVVKHARSNAIVVAMGGQTLGIGAGHVSRIDAARQALEKAGSRAQGAVLASDGFFPFSDVVELAASCGIAAIIQPGGSVRDHESITAADRAGLAMVFTGIRHFRH